MNIYYFLYTNLPAVKGIEGLENCVQGRSWQSKWNGNKSNCNYFHQDNFYHYMLLGRTLTFRCQKSF